MKCMDSQKGRRERENRQICKEKKEYNAMQCNHTVKRYFHGTFPRNVLLCTWIDSGASFQFEGIRFGMIRQDKLGYGIK